MESRQSIILISASSWACYWANYFGYEIIRIEDESHIGDSGLKFPMITIKTNFKNKVEIKNLIQGLLTVRNVVACFTNVEQLTGLAHAISKEFELPYLTCGNYNLINNKLYMREILNPQIEAKVPAEVISDYSQLVDFVSCHQKIILKPVNGFGSQSVSAITTANVEQFSNVEAGKFIAEKFIDGEEFSVEAFSYAGDHRLLGITHKIVDSETFSEVGHIFPADLSDQIKDMIWNSVSDYLTKLDFRNGPSHTEIKYYNDKVYLIETHNRTGGDHIPQLVELTTGFNSLKNALAWSGGKISPSEHQIAIKGYAASYFIFAKKSGVLKRFANTDAIRWMQGVKDVVAYFLPGNQVQKTTNSFNRLGHIIVYGQSHDDCMQSIRNVEQYLDIEIE